jgi:maltooligosyltrehalose trehalohydrolase
VFMGDEWGAREPFPFFCDFKGELAEAVSKGRRREFAEAYEKYHDEVPDPLSEQTVRLATLDWSKASKPEHARRLDLVRRLLAARKTFVVPRLPQLQAGHGRAEFSCGVLTASWDFHTGETLELLTNLSDSMGQRPQSFRGEPVWGGVPPAELPPWSVFAAIGAR